MTGHPPGAGSARPDAAAARAGTGSAQPDAAAARAGTGSAQPGGGIAPAQVGPARADSRAASARQIRRWLRQRRYAGAANRVQWDTLYTVGLVLLIAGAGLASQLHRFAIHAPAGAAPPRAFLAIGLAWYALVLGVGGGFGPVAVSPATVMWLATAPISRRGLLWPAATVALVGGAAAGAAEAALLIALSARPHPPGAGASVAAVLVGTLGGVSVAALTIVMQSGARRRAVRPAALALGTAAVATALLPLPTALVRAAWLAGPWGWPVPVLRGAGPSTSSGYPVGHLPATAIVFAAAVLAVAAGTAAAVRLASLRLAALNSATSATGLVVGSAITLDPGLASRVAEERRFAGRRLARNRIPRYGGATGALVASDVLALGRAGFRLLVIFVCAAVPASAAVLGVAGIGRAALWLVAALAAVAAATGNARRDQDFPALARLLGLPGRALLATRAVTPACLAGLWGALSLGLLGARLGEPVLPWLLLGAATAPGLAAAGLRAARRSAMRHDLPLIITPMGAIPSGPMLWMLRGTDIAVALLLPALAALARGTVGGAVVVQLLLSLAGLGAYLAFTGPPGAQPKSP